MSLLLRYELVQHTVSSISSNIIRFGAFAVTQSATIGEAAISENTWDDPDGTWDVKGYREFYANETSAPSNNQVIYNGFVQSRTYHREGSFRTAASRRIVVETIDGNAALGFRILFDGTGSGNANRPAETAGDRIRWLVNQSGRLPSLYAHPTYFANPTNAMDANDYRGQRYNDVLADIANTTGYNFWVQYDEGRQRSELIFMSPDSTDYTSTLSISNSLADVDSALIFAPSEDAELHRDPSRIAAGAYIAYDGGAIYQVRDSIANEFALVDQTAGLGNIKSAAKARAVATRYQDDNDEEDDRITCSIVVPAASVNLLRQGMRVLCKFTHLPGYESFRYLRVLKRSVVQEEATGSDYYRLVLELSGPGTAATGGGAMASVTLSACNTVVEDSLRSASDTASGPTFAAGQVWQYTLSQPSHGGDAYTHDFALIWNTIVPTSSSTTIRGWGVSVLYPLSVGYPIPQPNQGSYPAYTALSETGTFVITSAGTGRFTFYANADYPVAASVDECWTILLERLS